jgi:hypothetical protein
LRREFGPEEGDVGMKTRSTAPVARPLAVAVALAALAVLLAAALGSPAAEAFSVSGATTGFTDAPNQCGQVGQGITAIVITAGGYEDVDFCLDGTGAQGEQVLIQVWDDDPGWLDFDDEIGRETVSVPASGSNSIATQIRLECNAAGRVVGSQGESSVDVYFEIGGLWPYYGYGATSLNITVSCVCPAELQAATSESCGVGGILEDPDVEALPSEAADSSGGLSAGVIAGIGGAAAAAVVTAGGGFARWRRRIR